MKNIFPAARMASAALHKPRLTLVLVALALIFSVSRVGQIELRTSNLDLIDPDLPEVRKFEDFADAYGTPNALVVVLEGEDPDALRDAVDLLAPRLRAREDVRAVIERLPYDRALLIENGLDPYLANGEETMFFIFVQPKDARSQASLLAPFVAGVREIIAQARLEESECSVGLTGIPKYALDDGEIIKGDITRLSLLALLLISLIFGLGFRALTGPLAATFTVIVGFGLTLGLVSFYPGHLTLLSAMFVSMIFGLGIDCGIHIVSHLEDAHLSGLPRTVALERTFSELQRPLNMAAFTTAGVFYGLTFSGFKGFAELGFIAGSGILLCYLMMLTFLPALLVVLPIQPRHRTHSSRISRLLLKLQSKWFAPVLLACSLLIPLIGWPAFDSNYLNLQPEDSEAARLERRMMEFSEFSPYFAVFVSQDMAQCEALSERLREEPTVAEVRSLTDLAELFDVSKPPEELAGLFLSEQGDYATYAYPAGDVWDEQENRAFIDAMRAIDPRVTGMPFLGDFMIQRSRDALRVTAVLSLIVLFIATCLDFREPRRILQALSVPLLTMAWMGALMKLAGIAFNPLNVMAIPIVLGIAIDDAVHMLHRFEHERGQLVATLAGAGRGVVLTSMTTLAAFGSVVFTDHRGLQSFCLALSIGVLVALILSVVVLPWLLTRSPAKAST